MFEFSNQHTKESNIAIQCVVMFLVDLTTEQAKVFGHRADAVAHELGVHGILR
jgi:hypothetical protein